MMEPVKNVTVRRTVFSSLPLQLAGMLALSTAFFFIAIMAYDILTGFAQSSFAADQIAESKRSIAVDPKIATDLEKVLTVDVDPAAVDVKDPFLDRAGLSGAIAGAPAAIAPGFVRAVQPGAASTSADSSKPITNAASLPTAPIATPVEATRARYEAWLRQGGDGPLDPRVFSIEDLLPVGIVDGGSGGQEVMFFSEAVGKTVSFPVGTLFFDGWLSELRPEGVVFSSNDDRRTLRMRSWARSTKGDS